MKAILVIDLNEDVKLNELEIVYVIQDKFGTPVNVEVDGAKLKPLPDKIDQGYPCSVYDEGYGDGWDKCIDKILGEEE